MNHKNLSLILTILFISVSYCQSSKVNTTGESTKIDSQKEILNSLKNKDEEILEKNLGTILLNPNKYNPTVLYVVSLKLFEQEKKDDAVFWYYVAQLRARYDSNLCLDKSAKQAAGQLGSMFGKKINPYAFEDLVELEIIVNKAIAFVKENEEDYDHRWINLHGMSPMIKSLAEKEGKSVNTSEDTALTKPREEWPAIKQETIKTYQASFMEALVELKKRKKM
jgi:hypothetical protein